MNELKSVSRHVPLESLGVESVARKNPVGGERRPASREFPRAARFVGFRSHRCRSGQSPALPHVAQEAFPFPVLARSQGVSPALEWIFAGAELDPQRCPNQIER